MMKNMPVGKKILLGFGAVILVIVLIVGMALVTSFSRNSDLTLVDQLNNMQKDANTMLENFLLARVEIRTVFSTIQADDEYGLAIQYLAEANRYLDKIIEVDSSLEQKLSRDLSELRSMFGTLQTGLDKVHANDLAANASLDKMIAAGSVMSTSVAELQEMVVALTMQLAEGDSVSVERLNAVLMPVQRLGDRVDEARILSRDLLYLQDVSAVDGIHAVLSEIEGMGAEMRGDLTTDQARAKLTEAMNAISGFRTSVDETQDILLDSEETINATRGIFLQLSDKVNECVEFIVSDVSAMNQSIIKTSELVTFVMVVIGLAALVFAVIIATILGKSITRPLSKMQAVLSQAGGSGNLNFSDNVREDILKEAESKDELGRSLLSFSTFVGRVRYIAQCLERVADRDLTLEIELLSEEDTMGLSLQKMTANLNDMFAEISNIAAAVASSSNEIAIGSQNLAEGSTEQAATVQQISASTNEINSQMAQSNQDMQRTAQQGKEIGKYAAEGNDKMHLMTSAMQDINNASQAIGQVMKVIDDIAFQTNILALNAAVEAARAGQHGKGFAVVADEVRNLAGKSADAAQKTSDLISDNIKKTEQGLVFTQETAESLTKIIESIALTNETLQSVAMQNEGIKTSTAQVTQAIDQVAQVVQQNSATSEESAAASHELNSQAQVLQELIAQFRLKAMPHKAEGYAKTGGDQPEEGPNRDKFSLS